MTQPIRWINVVGLLFTFLFFSCHTEPRPIGKEVDKEPEIVDSLITDPGSDTTFIPIDTSIIRNTEASLFLTTRFSGEDVFTENQIVSEEGQYWRANDYIGRPVNLGYTFKAPQNDTMQARPFVLMLHEGAFLFGKRQDEDERVRLLAQKGYATATIDYRIGFNGARQGFACNGNNLEVYQAIYRTVQDIYVALHYFMDNSGKFKIDPRNVIIGGSSAGGIAASAFLYMTEADFEKVCPGIVKTLGRLDPFPNHTGFKVRALLTNVGYAIIQSNYITKQNAVPTVFFQRTGDDVLAYEKGKLFFCTEYFSTEGSKNTSNRLQTLNIPFELNYEPLKGHQLSYPNDYIVKRYGQFVKRIWGGDRRQIINENYKAIQNKIVN